LGVGDGVAGDAEGWEDRDFLLLAVQERSGRDLHPVDVREAVFNPDAGPVVQAQPSQGPPNVRPLRRVQVF